MRESITLGTSTDGVHAALMDSNHLDIDTSADPLLLNEASTDPTNRWSDPFGLNLESTWWQTGDDFDLETVNLSLLQPGEDAQQSVPPPRLPDNPTWRECTRPDLRKKWHTYAASMTADQIAPASMGQPAQDESGYRQHLAENLRSRVQTGVLPSTAFLDLCTQAYFTQFHPIFPVIHAPTFRPSTQNSILLLSICSLGSLFLGSPRALAHGTSMFERLNKAMLASWETYAARGSSIGIVGIQAALLGQTFGLLVGQPTQLIGIEMFHGCVIAWARKAKLFKIEEDSYPSVQDVDGEVLEIAWRAWIELEERKRLLLAIHIHDTELAKLHHHEPLLRHSLERMPVLASDELFNAPSASAWRTLLGQSKINGSSTEDSPTHQLHLPNRSTHLLHPSDIQLDSKFQLCATLESIRALALEDRRAASWTRTRDTCVKMLLEWHESYSRLKNPLCLLVLWHATFMDLYADFDTLERVCGRDGEEAALRSEEYARTWAQSGDATKCLLHAAMIQKHLDGISVGSEAPIHVPQVLYSCGIALTCYSRFGVQIVTGGDMPDIKLLSVNPDKLLAEVTYGIKWGRPESISLFKVIDGLERVNRWKVAHSFATTLLALVEEAQDLF